MSSEELWANLFRTTQTEAKLKRILTDPQADASKLGEDQANQIHFKVWKKIRQTIHDLWWTMPENLKAAEHIDIAIKRLEELWITPSYEKKSHELSQNSYELPKTIPEISTLITIVRENPWSVNISLGKKDYTVSQEWHRLINTLLTGS